jgi:hypothetical protein
MRMKYGVWNGLLIYEGESKIIRNVGTCCAVGYIAGWAWCGTCGLLLSYCCGADVALIVDLCHEFSVIWTVHFSFAPKKSRGQWSVFYGHRVYQVPKCIEGYQCSVGTVLCHNGWSTNGSRGSRFVAQALSMRKEPDMSGSFLMLNTCATILEPLDPFVDHPLWHNTVPILHWYPSMHFGTWYTFCP